MSENELKALGFPRRLPFTKMEGLGNDYVYVEEFGMPCPDPARLAAAVSDRHFGVGGDGLVLIGRSSIADYRMRIFNADGSEAEMCGNASRCVGKYLYDKGFTDKLDLTLETGSGIRSLRLEIGDGLVERVRVNMGRPRLAMADIPMLAGGDAFVGRAIEAAGRTFTATALSMGNPHLVVPTPDVGAVDIGDIGPALENHPWFPKRVNVEFAEVIDRSRIRMRVWERGSGETMACGTGACATLVACALGGLCDRQADIDLPGGTLHIEWEEDVFMTGPANFVFSGEYQIW